MCVSPLRIANKGYDPKDVLTSPYVYVNCRHCWQCQLQRSNDMSFRMLQELPNSVPFFVTLTYNDKFLPKLTYKTALFRDGKPVLRTISVWNKKHVQDLHKRVRRKLHYYFGVSSNSFKYLCCCERGSSDGYVDWIGKFRVATSRPHFHLLYMLLCSSSVQPIRPLPDDFYLYCRYHDCNVDFVSFFQYLLSSEWFFGHVDDVAFCRDVTSATSYVTKYCCKSENEPLSFINLSDIVFYYDFYSLSKHSDIPFSSLVPRSFSSINLGISFLKHPNFFDYVFHRKPLCLPFVRSASLINVPSYYINKLSRTVKPLSSRCVRHVYSVQNEGCHPCVDTGLKSPSLRLRWSSKRGLYSEVCSPSRSETILTPFGRSLRRFNLVNSFKKFVSDSTYNIVNSVHSDKLINTFYSLPHDIQNLFQFPLISDFRSFRDFNFRSDSLFFRYVGLRHFFFEDLVNSDFSFQTLSDIINFNKLCSFTSTHLKHVAFTTSFKNKLNHSVSDNPELFLNHYL